jgi:hypothetical protein
MLKKNQTYLVGEITEIGVSSTHKKVIDTSIPAMLPLEFTYMVGKTNRPKNECVLGSSETLRLNQTISSLVCVHLHLFCFLKQIITAMLFGTLLLILEQGLDRSKYFKGQVVNILGF